MNHYEELGVDRGAEAAVIEAAYRVMMRRYHPDVYPGPKSEADQKSRALNAAYEILKDPEKRRAYDASLGPPPPAWQARPIALPGAPAAPKRRIFAFAVLAAAIATAIFGFAYFRDRHATSSQVAVAAYVPPAPAAEPPAAAAPAALEKPAEEQACRGSRCRTMTPFGAHPQIWCRLADEAFGSLIDDQSGGEQNSLPEELVVSASVHLSLYGFNPVDLTFDRARCPAGRNRALHGIDVARDAGRKAGDFTVCSLFEPSIEPGHVVAFEQRDELCGEPGHRAKLRCLRIKMMEESPGIRIDLTGILAQIPGTAPA